MRQNIGVGTFARQYGGRNKRKGAVPEHFAKASRGLIRHILKQVRTAAVTEALLSSSSRGWLHSCPAAQALALWYADLQQVY